MARIEIDRVEKSFGAIRALRSVSLGIGESEFVSLLGPSGCGKSTLLRVLAGLETQDSGSVRIDGQVVDRKPAKERDLAMVFQSYALYPHLTVAGNIAVPLVMRRLGWVQRLPLVGPFMPGSRRLRGSIDADVRRVAGTLQVEHLLARKPGQLSGGQRQRVAIARAIVREPKAFLMDEPLSNLDAKLRVQMRSELAQLRRRLGATFLYVTHDQAEAMTMSDRIAVMIDGEILQVASPDHIYNEPEDIRVAEFIGSPRINVIDAVSADAGQVRVNGARVAVAEALTRPGSAIRLAFRPESARIGAVDAASLRGRVTHTETLGSDFLIHVSVEGVREPIIARSDPSAGRPAIGEHVGVSIASSRMLIFGADAKRLPRRTPS